ncbi:hypothetical protein BJ742DRAFT_807525 [Cladochytrium replicatum]|nr:hypothetical protein BJ742DRAFT_807525 [Cladochytrium replicatum]
MAQLVLLFGPPKRDDEPSSSGFCQKLETYLRFAGITYTHKSILPPSAPRGKVPFIQFKGQTVPDSHFAIRFLVSRRQTEDAPFAAHNLDLELTPSQRADTAAWRSYWEDRVYPMVVRQRWFIKENRLHVADESFDTIPWILRPLIVMFFTWRVKGVLNSAGAGRYTDGEVEDVLENALKDLSAKLEVVKIKTGGQRWFHGTARPTEIDAILSGFLLNFLGTKSNPFVNERILRDPVLTEYISQGLGWYPEYQKVRELIKKDH